MSIADELDEDETEIEISALPNPTMGLINFSWPELNAPTMVNWTVSSQDGTVRLSESARDNFVSLDLSAFSAGPIILQSFLRMKDIQSFLPSFKKI